MTGWGWQRMGEEQDVGAAVCGVWEFGVGERLGLIDGLHLHAWVERDMSLAVHGARLDLRQADGT